MLKRYWTTFLVLVVSVACFAKERHTEGALAVELSSPFEAAAQVVSEVAADGTIRGTGQYKTESEITGALPAQQSNLLQVGEVSEGTSVFYKVRTGTLAPRHYENSNDVGTLVVAYTVQKISSDKSRLTIESVFVPDSRHGRSASDGSVETCEFTAIETRLKAVALAKDQAKQQQQKEQQEVRVRTLRSQLADEQARFDALKAQAQQLEKRSAELRQLSVVRSKSSSAPLKALPNAHAGNVRSLSEGEELDVLYRTDTWYRVRAGDGQVGWVYYSFLGPAQ